MDGMVLHPWGDAQWWGIEGRQQNYKTKTHFKSILEFVPHFRVFTAHELVVILTSTL